jgi:hypothetical protein
MLCSYAVGITSVQCFKVGEVFALAEKLRIMLPPRVLK